MLYDKNKLQKLENTQLNQYLKKIFEYAEGTLLNLNKNLLEKNMSKEQIFNSLALQVITNLYFQFEGNDLEKKVVDMAIRIYLSKDIVPYKILHDFLYIDKNNKYIGIEKEYAIKEMIIHMYNEFYDKYNTTNDPETIKIYIVNLELEINKIKEMKNV